MEAVQEIKVLTVKTPLQCVSIPGIFSLLFHWNFYENIEYIV